MLLPFAFPLPYETPLTLGGQRICLHTTLGIVGAVDSKQTNILHIRPHPAQRQVLDALAALGFQLARVEARYQPLAGRAHPIVQGLEFLPARAHRQAIEQLEVIFDLREHQLEVLTEIDGRARGLDRRTITAYDVDERYARIQVPYTGLDRAQIVEIVEQAIESLHSEVER
jgi:sporulation-control protein